LSGFRSARADVDRGCRGDRERRHQSGTSDPDHGRRLPVAPNWPPSGDASPAFDHHPSAARRGLSEPPIRCRSTGGHGIATVTSFTEARSWASSSRTRSPCVSGRS
jgi:hypothetical protein